MHLGDLHCTFYRRFRVPSLELARLVCLDLGTFDWNFDTLNELYHSDLTRSFLEHDRCTVSKSCEWRRHDNHSDGQLKVELLTERFIWNNFSWLWNMYLLLPAIGPFNAELFHDSQYFSPDSTRHDVWTDNVCH